GPALGAGPGRWRRLGQTTFFGRSAEKPTVPTVEGAGVLACQKNQRKAGIQPGSSSPETRRPRTPRGRFLSTGGNSPGLWCRRQAQHMHFIASPTISIQKQRAVGSTETSLLCHVGGFYPRDVDAAWLRDGRVLGSTRSSPQRNLDGTFSLALTYTFTPAKSDTGSLLLPPRWRKSSASGTLVSGGGAGARVTLFLGWGIQPRSLPQRKPQKMRGHGGEGGNVAQQQHRCDAAQPQK
uniref:Ig-like domain-containing protein n=1 Tax=Crocodylus porosus TaxID=8502 RepID=A0A7M4FM10_CROPO